MCAEDNRGRAWIRTLMKPRDEADWPKLVWQDLVGLFALGALLAALVARAAAGGG